EYNETVICSEANVVETSPTKIDGSTLKLSNHLMSLNKQKFSSVAKQLGTSIEPELSMLLVINKDFFTGKLILKTNRKPIATTYAAALIVNALLTSTLTSLCR
ncbi:unnamed protein product, partial [Ceratitis capitata]